MSMQSLRQYLSGSDATEKNSTNKFWTPSRNEVEREARFLAEQICSGFQLHDRRQHEEAVDAFFEVDRGQFNRISDDDAYTAAEAYVDALWAKDEIEKRYSSDGEIDPEAIADADYSSVEQHLRRRSEAIGMDEEYATKTTVAWHNHKTGDDYWTPFMRAQTIELRVALNDPSYPDKPRGGQSGFGPLATRYATGVELHDMHSNESWENAIRLMTPYYSQILTAHQHP